jgi:hypothetical protein
MDARFEPEPGPRGSDGLGATKVVVRVNWSRDPGNPESDALPAPKDLSSFRLRSSQFSAVPGPHIVTATIGAGLLLLCVSVWAGRPVTPIAKASAANQSYALSAPSGSLSKLVPEGSSSDLKNVEVAERPIQDAPDAAAPTIQAISIQASKVEPTFHEHDEERMEDIIELSAPSRDLKIAEQVREVQQRLADLGFLRARATGAWGPLSRDALRAFKEARQLGSDDAWDSITERSLFETRTETASYTGVWAPDASACSARLNRKRLLPALIDPDGARAGNTSCVFRSKTREATTWNIVATCSNTRSRWTAKVRLSVSGNELTWTSQRGSQSYVRCDQQMMMAQAYR